MLGRQLLFCALIGVVVCSCSAPRPRASAGSSATDAYAATIARIERTDPGSPTLLNARLAYGEFLLSGAPGPCAPRLVLAQEQLGTVDASAKTRVLFPQGWARASDLEYRLHVARAECAGKAGDRDDLLAAVEAARRAVTLYRRAFDYHSMVVMQFDAAMVLRRLGDNAAAVTALEAALDMDREYGFADDARQNYGLLLDWEGKPSGTAQVAGLMRDFPARRATLKFRWHPTHAHIRLEVSRYCLEDGEVVHSHATAAYEHDISAEPSGGFSVKVDGPLTWRDTGVWPAERNARTAQLYFPPLRLPALDFTVSAAGEFRGVTNSEAFSTRLTEDTDRLIKAGAPADDAAGGAVGRAIDAAAIALSPGMLEAATSESYQLETAMWIGATLDQGVWYQLSAPLTLPGISRIIVQQRMEFAFTRRVACAAGMAAGSCIEIVIHATPDKEALQALLADIPSPFPNLTFRDYDASIDARIVVDPTTLLAHEREERVYWYASFGKDAADTILESDHLVSTSSYGDH